MSMTAAMTVDAVDELGIKPGSDVIVIVEASDVMLAVEWGPCTVCAGARGTVGTQGLGREGP